MRLRAFFVVFVYVIAANVPLWIASYCFSLSMAGVFDIEFLILGALSLYLRQTLAVCLLLVAVGLDLLNCVGKTYWFSLSELFLSAPSFIAFAPSHFWKLIVLVICTGLLSIFAVLALRDRPNRQEQKIVSSVLLSIAIIGIAVDSSRGQIKLFPTDYQVGAVRLIRTSVTSLIYRTILQRDMRRQVPHQTEESVTGASAKLVELDLSGELYRSDVIRPNVVLIMTESWGKHLSSDVDESLVRPYMRAEIAERYTVSRGTVPFRGATVAGEIRELCGSTLGLGVINVAAAQLKNCLPSKMSSLGYHTVGVHGFSAGMFERKAWYRKIRFEETWFRDQLNAQGLPLCPGPFPGICDASVAKWIGDRMTTNSAMPQFIYWVTLNSHLPVPVPNLVKDPPTCSGVGELNADAPICSWYQLIFNVHRSVAELAMKPMMRPTVFVIVGDHAPPFASAKLRGQFSDSVVPYVVLWPKNGIDRDSQSMRMTAATSHPIDHRRKPS